MPQEIESQFGHVTQEQWDAIRETSARHIVAARALVARRVMGIPRKPYLVGENDHAPIVQGIAEFADKVWNLLDLINDGAHPDVTGKAADEIQQMMEQPDGL